MSVGERESERSEKERVQTLGGERKGRSGSIKCVRMIWHGEATEG